MKAADNIMSSIYWMTRKHRVGQAIEFYKHKTTIVRKK